ncbi:UNVERIFIED_CONTAM: hypothetical protein HDU68_007155 [Siphonaria sp. JEL0065]|nr:hypothetical protein HDU68_007155 [Siphonaria sp. JEL0065]
MDIVLWVYNIGLLLGSIVLVVKTRDAESYTGESTFAAAIVASLCVIGIAIIPILVTSTPSVGTILLGVGTIGTLICTTLGSILIPKLISIFSDYKRVESQLKSFFKLEERHSSFIQRISMNSSVGAKKSKMSSQHREKLRKMSKVDVKTREAVKWSNLVCSILLPHRFREDHSINKQQRDLVAAIFSPQVLGTTSGTGQLHMLP